MEGVYKEKPFTKPTYFQRLLKIKPKINAIIEINNKLAQSRLLDVSIDEIQTVADKYKVKINKEFETELLQFYASYLEHCFIDRFLSENEINELKHLKSLFNLSDTEVKNIHEEITAKVYREEIDKAIKDERLDENERAFIDKIKNSLQLPDDITIKIYKERSEVLIKQFIEKSMSDQRISPDEEKELEAIAASLNVRLEYDGPTKQLLDKFKLYWQIENDILPTISSKIILQKGENCHFCATIDWLEQRRATRRINYGGPTLRIKIAKGLYWRAGSLGVQRITEDVWQVIDSGDLYLTNKRIIFMGSRGNKTIPLKKVLDFNVFSNGIDIQKESGKSPFFKFSDNTDIFSMILGKLINEM